VGHEVLIRVDNENSIVKMLTEITCCNCDNMIVAGCICCVFCTIGNYTSPIVDDELKWMNSYFCKECEREDPNGTSKLLDTIPCEGRCEAQHITWGISGK
jgi:hypothetical protein